MIQKRNKKESVKQEETIGKTIGLAELTSITYGIAASDAMLKAGQVTLLRSAPACPGKYLILIAGDTGEVKAAMEAGAETAGKHLRIWWQKRQRCAQAQKVLEEFHLAELAKKRPSQVSGGEQQRAAIARAVVNHPKLLIADEPTGNLDEENTKNVMELLTGLNENGMGIILVTHDPYAASFAKRKYVLEHGVLKEERNRN